MKREKKHYGRLAARAIADIPTAARDIRLSSEPSERQNGKPTKIAVKEEASSLTSSGVVEIEVNDEASFLILTGVVEIEVEEEVFFLTSIRVVEIEVEEETSFLGSIRVDEIMLEIEAEEAASFSTLARSVVPLLLGTKRSFTWPVCVPGRPLASVRCIHRTWMVPYCRGLGDGGASCRGSGSSDLPRDFFFVIVPSRTEGGASCRSRRRPGSTGSGSDAVRGMMLRSPAVADRLLARQARRERVFVPLR